MKAVERKFLPFHQAWIGEEEKKEILDTLESGWLTKGPKTAAFEKQFADFLNVPYAVGTNSCTAALHLALLVSGVEPGDEVITTPITFAATVNVIEHCGAKPVFVDVEEETLNINPDKIERAITPRTRVILPVHFAGRMCRMDRICDVARKHNLIVVEDAAHAIESDYNGRKPGSWGDLAAFSFYPTKNITTGEGGMVVTGNSEWAERLVVLSLHGLSRNAWKRYHTTNWEHAEILEPGFKYHMTDLQASLGIHQLKKIDFFRRKRKELAECYDEAFSQMEGISVLRDNHDGKSAFHLYVIRLKPERLKINRDRFLELLQEDGIGVGVHFIAIHLQPYYRKKYPAVAGTIPIAEKASEEILSLPLYPKMNLEDARYVVDSVRRIIHDHAK